MSNIINEPTTIELAVTEDLTVKLSYKELMGKKGKALGKKYDGINGIRDKRVKVTRKLKSANAKLDAYTAKGDNDKILETLELIDNLYDENDKLDEQFESLGGIDIYEKFSKEQFDKSVTVLGESGKVFTNWIEAEYSYFSILQLITEKVIEARGK